MMLARTPARAMPERWTELNTARRQRQRCAEDIETLRTSFEKEQASQDPKCYRQIVERMQSRYQERESHEWFTDRKAFLQELDGLFADVKQGKRSLRSVESRIESEKEAWYRWMLRRHPDFLAVADGGAHQARLRSILDDPDQSREDLVSTVWEGVGQPEQWSSRVDDFASKVAAIGDDEAELRKFYEAEFFIDASSGNVLEHAQKFLDDYRSNPAMKIEEAVEAILKEQQLGKGSQLQRDSHIKRLNELRRAKTAAEQEMTREPGSQPRDELYALPPCLVCQQSVDIKDVFSCPICQGIVQMRGEGIMTVYCSETCYNRGHGDHVEKRHDCVAGDRCIQLQSEDVTMEDESLGPVLCKDCLDQKAFSLYCAEACAVAHIADHRQSAHGVKTAPEETQGLVTRLAEALPAILQKENPGLKMTNIE